MSLSICFLVWAANYWRAEQFKKTVSRDFWSLIFSLKKLLTLDQWFTLQNITQMVAISPIIRVTSWSWLSWVIDTTKTWFSSVIDTALSKPSGVIGVKSLIFDPALSLTLPSYCQCMCVCVHVVMYPSKWPVIHVYAVMYSCEYSCILGNSDFELFNKIYRRHTL